MYRPRKPRASALYQCAARHAPELKAGGRFGRRVEEKVIGRFLECGDPRHGFARIYSAQCRYACFLAFSCKARYFCPSCHQKRVLAYGDWVDANVLAPVPHRQYVFTLPRLLRPMFARFDASARPGARPGIILFVQTFGDLVNFNPHIHVLAADGAFDADGGFTVLPPIPRKVLEPWFRKEVLALLQSGAASPGEPAPSTRARGACRAARLDARARAGAR